MRCLNRWNLGRDRKYLDVAVISKLFDIAAAIEIYYAHLPFGVWYTFLSPPPSEQQGYTRPYCDATQHG